MRSMISDEVLESLDSYSFLFSLNHIDENCSIKYFDELEGFSNVLEFSDFTPIGYLFSTVKFNNSQSYGNIQFFLKTTNSSKYFKIQLSSTFFTELISIKTDSSQIQYFNGSSYLKIIDFNENLWYNISIFFEATDNHYKLDNFKWKISINGTEYGDFRFLYNSSISYISFGSSLQDDDLSVFFSNFKFSWEFPENFEFSIVKYPVIIDYLQKKQINYFIYTTSESYTKQIASFYIDIDKELIPNYFKTNVIVYVR